MLESSAETDPGSRLTRPSSMTGYAQEGDTNKPSRMGRRERSPLRRENRPIQQSSQESHDGSREAQQATTGLGGRFNPNPAVPIPFDPARLQQPGTARSDDRAMESSGPTGGNPSHERQMRLPVVAEPVRPPVRGVQETAGTSILSIGTAAQIRGQRNRFIAELGDLIDSDTAAWRENRRIVQELLSNAVEEAKNSGGK